MSGAILIDFGSTYTKVAVASLDEQRILFTGRFHSTVNSDARIGLAQCLDAARSAAGKKYFLEAVKLASSSAAGGLRMGVIGLSRSLSITAGRNTVFGAGAKILKTLSGMITEGDAESLSLSSLEILLFCGGYERGSRLALLHNAEILAHSRLDTPIIYAGNSSIARDVRRILTLGGKECFIVDNIIPNVGELNPLPAQSAIRDVFMKRIVNMKGLEDVSKSLDAVLMPTPAAVLSAGDLLSKGWSGGQGLGGMMVVDIGGATTDIHSFAQQLPYKGARLIGASEAYAKRTVEGDLGMRESSNSLVGEIGWDFLAKKLGMVASNLEDAISHRVHFNAFLPETDEERAVDRELACGAARIASRRHAGFLEPIHSSNCKMIQRGKNLTGIHCIVGTGGQIIESEDPRQILREALVDRESEPQVLLPEAADFFLDSDYILYAAGLLREINPEAALGVMNNSLKKL